MALTLGFSISLFAQNTAENILGSDEKLIIGGYGQIDGNFNLDDDNKMNSNGKLDVHRLVTFLGYKFSDKVTFVSEVEYEHIVELYVEQVFLDYKIKDNMSLQAGLMLIPMGIQNLYHEPPTFNGVERTNVDTYIIPTTWREIGVGLSGRLDEQSLNYQLMVVNGPLGYDNGDANFSGSNGIRSGRQKGAEAIVSDFDFAGRVSYYGMLGWNFGASFYQGNSETTDFEADSTQVGVTMMGIDARYNNGAFQARGQYTFADLENTAEYNAKTSSDVGSKLLGYYVEAGYNLLEGKSENELIAFARYENYNTHEETDGFDANLAYDRTDKTFGLTYKLNKGAAFKADYQLKSNEASTDETKHFNLGVAVWF
ncbi:MAG: hypothetical protein ISP73_07395 [Flavobacteriales bacterium]|nr:hypothetical protein [Flavobacteriales bacterium]